MVAPAISVIAALLAGVWLVDRTFALDLRSFELAAVAAIAR